MKILSIETSCDETAISLLDINGSKINILGNALYSQIKLHKQYGGVFPMMAKREHQKKLCPILIKVLSDSDFFRISKSQITISKESKLKKILERETDLVKHFLRDVINIKKPKIDLIAVTKGPGLEPALWVGISFAKALGELWNIPVIGVNHMEGHIVSVLINKKESSGLQITSSRKNQFPALSLLVSGGHTELILVKGWGKYEVIGKTKDDAVGEAFDKVARILGLPYPGGPQISNLASEARKLNLKTENYLVLPRPVMHTKDFDFSFSGLKTAVLYIVQKIKKEEELKKKDQLIIAKEFEDACVDVLIYKTKKAIEKYGVKSLIVGGGVSANNHLRSNLKTLANNLEINLHIPDKKLATDNAIMIGIAGYLQSKRNKEINEIIEAQGNLSLTK